MLLTLSILIAPLSITNTLSLSIHERRRELGLLRAIGQTRRQTKAMIRGEAVIVAVLGTISGLSLRLFVAWALVAALAGGGELAAGSFTVPVATFALIGAFGARAGVLAAVSPARRAARLDLLPAIAAE